jgi:tRNA nucleotidyltransferase/poly(A) polymerase
MESNVHELKRISPDRIYAELKKVYAQCEYPSQFFYILRDCNALKYHFKALYVMDNIKAGSYEYHGNNTAFDHTMEAINRCKANGYDFDIFLAVLFHDTGKGVTKKVPAGERQKHIGHEIMSYAINQKIVEQNRFSAHENELIILFARQHMIFHILQNFKNYVRLVRWFRKVKRHWEKLLLCANCDHPLTLDQIEILLNLDKVFKETKIDIPKNIKGENVVNFVESAYAKAYAKLVKK